MKSAKIQVLNDREHVLKRPGMYLGSTHLNSIPRWIFDGDKIVKREVEYIPAIMKLFDEVISNSIDEGIKTEFKFADRIDVEIKDSKFVIRDNGRGISHEVEENLGQPQAVVAFTQLKAGSNFSDDSASIGQNGVGVSCVNIFSKTFQAITCDGEKTTTVLCSDNMSSVTYKVTGNSRRGTEVSFTPDYSLFKKEGLDDIYINMIKKRILDLSMCYPDIRFSFNGEHIQSRKFKDYIAYYSDVFESFTFNNVSFAIFPSEEYDQISFVNGIETRKGGQHVDYAMMMITYALRTRFMKKYPEIKPTDFRNKFTIVLSLRNFVAPRFDSQTKEELINPLNEFKSLFSEVEWESSAIKMSRNEELMAPVIETFKIKEEMKKRALLAATEKKIVKSKIAKFVDSISQNKKECSLYLCEGDSAISQLLNCRSEIMAGYPLRGKFINCYELEDSEVLQNKEVQNLLSILNLKLSSNDIKEMTFGKICILADQDVDGDSITNLLICFFEKYWPKIIEEGRLYRVLSPLLVVKEKETKEKKVFYSIDDFNQVNSENKFEILEYNKGLGSLTAEAYSLMLNNPVMIQIQKDPLAGKNLKLAFSRNAQDRKFWLLNETTNQQIEGEENNV